MAAVQSSVAPPNPAQTPTAPPTQTSARFVLELEFVLSLSNPYYLQYLAQTYPHLFNPPQSNSANASDSDAACFARYLEYLYEYWQTPQYSQYLTHPGATLRNLELLQQERFRRDIIRPDVIARLLEDGTVKVDEVKNANHVTEAAEGHVEPGVEVHVNGTSDPVVQEKMDTTAG